MEKHKSVLCNWCAELYEKTEEYDLRNVEILVGTQLIESIGETDVLFEHKQGKNITEIRQAKYNRETLKIFENGEIAQKFADEFIALKIRKVW